MKKIIIIAVIAVVLAAAAVLFIIGKNDVVSADVTMDISQVTVDKFSGQDERDIIARIDKENRIADVLSDLDWVDHAVVTVSDSDKDLFVAAVLTVSREPSSDDAGDAAYIISRYVENADILITDQNSNVIYPVSE
ncbi:MAG: hypothetical protein HDT21_09585 [Ruminococcus sp.]|nr:hypothetical protein [Ruminococcus sp.]